MKKVIFGISIAAVACAIVLSFNFQGISITGKAEKEINLTHLNLKNGSLVYIRNYNANEDIISSLCSKIKSGDCKNVVGHGEEEFQNCYLWRYIFEFYLADMPEEIKPSYSALKCKAYSDNIPIIWRIAEENGHFTNESQRMFAIEEDTSIKTLSFPLDVRKDNHARICCKINGTVIDSMINVLESDETCLPEIITRKLC